ncbi:MAG: glycosyltransferase family 2 protein [Bacteroidales bacterium]|nr:glycosyltransferase family 2 protein [Bacteroidales bacterium]
MTTPKISVIVPVYKVEQYLHRCIDSILSQSFTDFELLLIDDGSPDNCGKICDEYAQKDSRVRVFHKPNGGVSSARNLGLDNAKGEWMAFIDSDDYVENEYLEELLSYETNTSADIITSIKILDTTNNSVTLQRKEFGSLFSVYGFDKNCTPWGKLLRKDIISNNNLKFNTRVHLGEDAMFVLSYLLDADKITLISSNKYNYEKGRPNSLTKKINSYESELAGKEEFEGIVRQLINELNLDDLSIKELEKSQRLYIERTLVSIMRLPNQKDRLNKLQGLDLSLYNKYTKPYNWKEKVLLFLLRKKFFYIYDMILHL